MPDWTAWVDDNSNSNSTNRSATWCFNACHGAPADMSFITPLQATFKGLIFDTITRIGPSAPTGHLSAVELQSWRGFAGIEHTGSKAIEDFTEAEIAFGATLCGGMGADWRDGDLFLRPATVEQDWSSFTKWQAWVESNRDMFKWDIDVANFNSTYMTAVLDRRLVSTGNGHLVLAPVSTMEGDVVAVLAGGRLPYVLRPRRREEGNQGSDALHEFVGDAYVFGIMDGEAWPEDESGLSYITME